MTTKIAAEVVAFESFLGDEKVPKAILSIFR